MSFMWISTGRVVLASCKKHNGLRMSPTPTNRTRNGESVVDPSLTAMDSLRSMCESGRASKSTLWNTFMAAVLPREKDCMIGRETGWDRGWPYVEVWGGGV